MKRQRAEISSNVISHIKSAHPIEMWRSNKLGIKEKISRGNFELTDYGIKLVELVTPIVNDFQSIPTWLHDVENNPSGDVHVGVTPMLAGLYLISQIIKVLQHSDLSPICSIILT